jgi:predicted lipoprotein
MTAQRYRINSPTIAMVVTNDKHVSISMPAGSDIVVDSTAFDRDELVEVLWAEKRVMMFTQDIRARGEKVEEADG